MGPGNGPDERIGVMAKRDMITITIPTIIPALVVERWTPVDTITDASKYPPRGESERGYSYHITSREKGGTRPQYYLRISHSEYPAPK
jgi:hypothetical protein